MKGVLARITTRILTVIVVLGTVHEAKAGPLFDFTGGGDLHLEDIAAVEGVAFRLSSSITVGAFGVWDEERTGRSPS